MSSRASLFPGPVLAPVDFSPGSRAALVWAAQLADEAGQPLIVLHVVHDPAAAPGSYRGGDGLRPLEEVGSEQLEVFLEELRALHPGLAALREPTLRITAGLPPNRILEVAEESGASHIVMGSRGRTGLSHLLLGSKAERVVQLSPIPVTIIKADAEETRA